MSGETGGFRSRTGYSEEKMMESESVEGQRAWVKVRRSDVVHLCDPLDEKGNRRSLTLCGTWAPRTTFRWIEVQPPLAGGLRLCKRCATKGAGS